MSSHSQTFKGGNGSTAGKPAAVATMEVISKSNNSNSKKSTTTTSTSQHSTTSTSSSSSASSSSSSSTTSSTSKDPLKTRCSGLTQITRKTMVTSERLGRLSMALPLTPTPTPPELEDHHQQQEEEGGEGEGNESSRKLVLLPGGKWAAIQATSDTISRLKMPPTALGTAAGAGGVTKSISCNAEWCIAAPCSSSDELNHKGCIGGGGGGGGGSTAGSSASKPPTMQLSNSSASLLKSKTKATTYLQLYCHNYSHNHSHNGGSCAGGGGGSASASASGSGKGGGASFSSAHFNLSSSGGGGGPHDEPEREHWDKKIEFLLAVIGFAVDLGNVWRFPYVCYRNGGGAFLVAYCIMLLFGGLPLFFLELALGQYFSSGCLTIWKRLCPVMKGLGYAICMIDIYMGMYYNTIISWSLYYLYVSCQSLVNFSLPWDDCSHAWNTDRCQTLEQRGTSAGAALLNNRTNNGNSTATGNVTAAAAAAAAVELSSVSPAEEYFLNHVLQINTSSGIDSLGPIRSSLAVCLMLIFLVVYFSLWKGVKSTGKVVWVTALMPYFVIFVFLIRATTLEGAIDGIRFYLEPDWSKLKSINVWIDAATQIFFSLGPGFGTLMALSSYNKFHNNCYRDAILTSSINCLTSFIAGFVTFSILGFMSKKLNKDISTVVADGPGLVFVVYPEAISTMYGSVFFSILFFVMLITLGLDSTFGGLEAMITGLCDNYPHLLRRNREVFVAVLIVIIYLCALPTTTHGGNYLINLLDQHGTAMPVLFVVFAETIAICWFYGSEKFSHQIKEMLGSKPGIFWRICWRVISPLFLGFICIASLLELKPLKMGEYSYPQWSLALGWMITFSSLSCIPIYAVYHFCHTPGDSFEDRLRKCFTPVAMVSAGGGGGGVRGGGISSAAAAAASAMMDNSEESCPLKGETTSPSAAEMGNCQATSAAAAQHNLTTGESVGEPV